MGSVDRNPEGEVLRLKSIVTNLYGLIVRTLVSLKYLSRFIAVVATWRLLGVNLACWLLGFILFVGLIQLGIDRARRVAHPELRLSEWNI